jgi:chemotaxis protein methyltransferase CheR
MRNAGCADYKSFVNLLMENVQLRQKFSEFITINVSEFFRNPDHWKVLEEDIIPLLIQQRPQIKVWSAGCSTGEEAYSLAMLFQAKYPGHVKKIKATDLDQKVLDKARQALYSAKAAKTLPSDYFHKYMQPEDEYFSVTDEIKKMVDFARHDLLKDPYESDYDLILCRNVFIYLTEDSKQNLYRKFAASLRKGGILFIGSTEQIFQALEAGFQSRHTFFYQKI